MACEMNPDGSVPRLPLIVIGAGGVGAEAAEIAELMGLEVASFVDESLSPDEARYLRGIPVLPSVELGMRSVTAAKFVIAIGESGPRADVLRRLTKLNLKFGFQSLVHPAATVSRTATIGEGSILSAGAQIGPGVSLGKASYVGLNCAIGHDSFCGDFTSVYAGACISGGAVLGDRVSIGSMSVVRERTRLGNDVFVGAHSYVNRHVENGVLLFGTPAKPVRRRTKFERHLRSAEDESETLHD